MRTQTNGHTNGKHKAKQAAGNHRFPIRSGVPLPTRSLYPFHRMEVDQMFAIPSGVSQNSVRAAATQYVKKQGGKCKFRVLKTYGDSFGCWRVK